MRSSPQYLKMLAVLYSQPNYQFSDPSGGVTRKLAELMGTPSSALRQLLVHNHKHGHFERKVIGKRTYWIKLTDSGLQFLHAQGSATIPVLVADRSDITAATINSPRSVAAIEASILKLATEVEAAKQTLKEILIQQLELEAQLEVLKSAPDVELLAAIKSELGRIELTKREVDEHLEGLVYSCEAKLAEIRELLDELEEVPTPKDQNDEVTRLTALLDEKDREIVGLKSRRVVSFDDHREIQEQNALLERRILDLERELRQAKASATVGDSAEAASQKLRLTELATSLETERQAHTRTKNRLQGEVDRLEVKLGAIRGGSEETVEELRGQLRLKVDELRRVKKRVGELDAACARHQADSGIQDARLSALQTRSEQQRLTISDLEDRLRKRK